MKDKFRLDKDKKYLIYGAGGGGLKLINVFKEKGYCLKGFIDRRAANLGSVRGEAVWDLETLKELCPEADDIVIILTTKNVFDHTDIAYKLAEMGFTQCIYKPLPVLKGYSDEQLEKISKSHDIFLINIDIPEDQLLVKVDLDYRMYYKDSFMITNGTEDVLAWMPLELIFNYEKADAYENISMAAFFPLYNLYRLFLGNTNGKEDYILEDFFCYAAEWAYRNQVEITKGLKNSWIESRRESFAQMQEISDYDFDFFIRNAPLVVSGDKGKFYMVRSGRNRVVFLAAKGYRHIPVKLKLKDYERWIHKELFSVIQQYMEKEHITKTIAPVPHPYFKDVRAENVDYYRLVLFPIAQYIVQSIFYQSKNNVNGYQLTDGKKLNSIKSSYSVLCDLEDEGACSRYLDACGFSVSRIGKEKSEFSHLLDQLFYQEVIEVKEQRGQSISVLILDHYDHMESIINNNEIKSVICIDAKEKNINCLQECGYRYVKILGTFFYRNKSRMIQVYTKE